MRTPRWYNLAACQGMPLDVFFPSADQPPAEAVEVCAGCQVRTSCLDYAAEHHLTDGVWGGMSANERKAARKAARTAA